MERIKPYIAEFIGTFALIFIGIGAIHNAQGNLLLIAFAHGLAIAVFVSAAMHISGGHLNPAVTLGILLGRQITFPQALAYWGAQLLGGFTAGLVALCIFGSKVVIDSTPQLTPAISPLTGVLIEAILTFFLVFVVFGTGVDERGRKIGGLAIGLTIVIGILFAGPLTGGGINPARVFGPALATNFWKDHWVYWVGPFIGGAFAGLLYGNVFLKQDGRK